LLRRVNRGHFLQIENASRRVSNSSPLPADHFHTAGNIFALLLNGKMESRNETRLIRLFIRTIPLSEQRRRELFAACGCARFAKKVIHVEICTQRTVVLALPGSAPAALLVLPNLLFQHSAAF